MRSSRFAALSVIASLVACGGAVDGNGSDHGQQGGDGGSGPATVVARAFMEAEGNSLGWAAYLNIDLQNAPAPSAFCATASMTVGACCYFAPTPPVPTPLPGGQGAPATEESLGTMTVTHSGATLSTFDYVSGEYANLPATYTGTPWNPGDAIGWSATGGDIGAFSVMAPALAAPDVVIPSTLSEGAALALTWTPDGNAESMEFQILQGNGAEVVCLAGDSAGSVTVDGSLMGEFAAGTQLEIASTRSVSRYAQTEMGRVELETMAEILAVTKVE